MKKPIIAIDIDDVLAVNVPEFITYSNQKWGTRLTLDDYDEHWSKLWAVDHAEVEKRASEWHGSGIFRRYQKIDGAHGVLQRLKKKYELVIVTARRIELEQDTLAWIEEYFPEFFSEIHFAGMWDKISSTSHLETKAGLCREIGADFLIDDQPKHCLAAAEVGLQVLLFGKYPWNKAVNDSDNLKRAVNWQEVAEYFDGIS